MLPGAVVVAVTGTPTPLVSLVATGFAAAAVAAVGIIILIFGGLP